MKHKIPKHKTLIVFVHIVLCGIIHAHSMEDLDTIPLDPGIHYGVLSNGITYYIKPTKDTSSQINTYLLLKAGVAQQDSDQYEIAHVLEHIAFRAGKNMTIKKALNSGFNISEINANPSYDFIQYYCTSIDTKKKRNIAFQLFQDIIWNLEIRDEHLDDERSVIINEKAIRGAFRSNSLMNNLEDSMMGRSPNQPDDLVKYLSTFPKEPLLRYYKDWYRPDLMAIVVIGDISNVEEIENEIRDKFSTDKPMKNSRSVITRSNNYRNSTSQFIKQDHPFLSEDSNNQSVYLRLYMRQKESSKESGLKVLRNEQKRQLFIKLLRNRFDRQQDFYGAAFSVIPTILVPSTLGIKLEISINHGSVKKVLQNAIGVLKQLQSEGFSEQEFKNGRDDYLLSLSKTDTTTALYWWSNIRNHFVYERPLPVNKNELLMDMVNNLSYTTFNEFVKESIKTKPKDLDLIMMHPPGHKAKSYSEQIIRQWISESNSLAVNSYKSPKIPAELPSCSKVRNLGKSTIKKQTVTFPGISEYRLGNGIRIVLNTQDSTSLEKSIIKLHGFTAKGVGCYGKEDFFSALNAVDIVKNAGIGGLDKFELERYLAEKGFQGAVVPYVSYDEAGIRSTVTLDELEIALKLIYLYFTVPNENRLAFEDWSLKSRNSPLLNNINENDFQTRIRTILGDSTFLPKGTKALEGISKTDIGRAMEIYKDIYGNASAFTFIVAGKFPESKVLSLCRKYLGNLPTNVSQEHCISAVTREKFILPDSRSMVIPSTEFMQEVKVELVYISKINKRWNWKDQLKLLLLRRLMNSSVGHLQFNSNKRGSYNMGVGTNIKSDRLFNEVFIRFSCSLEDVNHIISQAQQIVQFYKTKTVDKNLFDKNVTHMISKYNNEMNSHSFMSDKIHDYYRYKNKWASSEEIEAYLRSLSPTDIKQSGHELLKGNPFEFKMIPSKGVK